MRLTFLFILIAISLPGLGQSGNATYQYTADLTRVVEDKVYVELSAPPISVKEITFYLPKIVPGTYSIADYGRFVSDFQALDKKGKKLNVEKKEENAWIIKDSDRLHKITYWVEDSYDTKANGPEIFWPAGTNIEEDKNFIINTSGFFGYFENMKEVPFQVNVIYPEGFYGSTGLIPEKNNVPVSSLKLESFKKGKNKRADTFVTTDYDELIDSPLMYSKPDTAIIKVGNTEVLIGSYSPNNKINADEIAASIREVLMAQKEYLGGKLPVDKYAFIFYFTTQPVESYGALEHSYSSMYFMPEATIEDMNQQLRDFAAHEFFHIVTPLTVHSEEIENFDFNDPKMSQHLWMYEGVTEYFAMNVQVKYGLISPEEYLQMIQEKMMIAEQFQEDLPFTELSKFTLDKHSEQYQNVYYKGALIGLCLDLKLRNLSSGKYGLRNLMIDLSKKYGKTKAFDDDELFDEIVKMTYPEIGTFFDKYVKNAEPLPLQELLHTAGVKYIAEEKFYNYSLGLSNDNVNAKEVNGKPQLYITQTDNMNDMGKALGFKADDVLIKINGEDIPPLGPELPVFIQQQQASLSTRDSVTFTVLRPENNQLKETELKARVAMVELTEKHILSFDENATPEQLAIRESWIKPD